MSALTKHIMLTTCPHCYTTHDHVNTIDADEPPDVGDVLICSMCGQPYIHDGGRGRRPSPSERQEILANDQFRKAQRQWLQTLQ